MHIILWLILEIKKTDPNWAKYNLTDVMVSGADIDTIRDFIEERPTAISHRGVGANGSFPIHIAASLCSPPKSQLLIEKQASVNSRDYQNNTALHNACLCGNFQLIQLLVDNDAHINERNEFGMTPLMNCIDDEKAVDLLLAKGADVSILDERGVAALDYASGMGLYQVVDGILQKEGVDVHNEDILGRTPLFRSQTICYQYAQDPTDCEKIESLIKSFIEDTIS